MSKTRRLGCPYCGHKTRPIRNNFDRAGLRQWKCRSCGKCYSSSTYGRVAKAKLCRDDRDRLIVSVSNLISANVSFCLAHKNCGLRPDRDDLIQECFVLACKLADLYDPSKASFVTYVTRCIRFMLLNICSNRTGRISRDNRLSGFCTLQDDDTAIWDNSWRPDVVAALSKAHTRDQAVIVRHHVFDESMEEIGISLGITKQRVQQIESRGLKVAEKILLAP